MDDASERWLPVVSWEGLYEVSDLGRVRSLDRLIAGRSSSRRRYRGRILTLGGNPAGYLVVSLWDAPRVESRFVHQLVAEAFIGTRPDGLVIRHLDGDRSNNRPGNLAYGTYSENNYDIITHGRHHNANKTHCRNGHEYTPENTKVVLRRDGVFSERLCMTCRRQIERDSQRRRAARSSNGGK